MTLINLDAARIASLVRDDGILIDLRGVDDYLKGHPQGAVSLLFEAGPGFGGRARDMLPLSAKLILLQDGASPLEDAAAMLRGKGFYVAGVADADSFPAVTTAQVEIGSEEASGCMLLDAGDPGAAKQAGARFIPVERLWVEGASLEGSGPIGVLSGWGVRAATAVGILGRLGIPQVLLVTTLPSGSRPPSAGPDHTIFRVRG